MLKIKDIIRYYVENYPYKNELSKTRITKMVFLADWYSALESGKQLTSIKWYFDHYGPYVNDVYDAAKRDRRLVIKEERNPYGNIKEIVSLREESILHFNEPKLDANSKLLLNRVIDDTKYMNWTEFINYVYSSYPVKNSNKYSIIKLEELGIECFKRGITY